MASPELKLDANTELSSRRTGMSFQRTRMSADRTLMSVIRTSLSLIGFGFTIAQVFQKLRDQDIITKAAAPRNFGLALVGLGIVMLVIGIVYHVQFMLGLRHLRESMREEGLIHGETIFPAVVHSGYGARSSPDRRSRDHEHGLSRRPVRIVSALLTVEDGRFAGFVKRAGIKPSGEIRFKSRRGKCPSHQSLSQTSRTSSSSGATTSASRT